MNGEIITIQPAALAPSGGERWPGPVVAYMARLRSEAGRRAMRWKLDTAAGILTSQRHDAMALPWHLLTPAEVAALGTVLSARYAARTTNATLAAVRGVLRECWRAGLIDADALARLGDVRPEPVTTAPAGRGLEAGEVSALFRAARVDPLDVRGKRDAAALALLFGGGLRAAEVTALDVGDFDVEGEAVTVQRGKGRKVRHVPLATGAGDTVGAWLEGLAEAPGGPLLRAISRHGAIGGRLSVRGLQRATDRLAASAGLASWTPHDARRSYIGNLLDAGADLATVQALAGHSNPQTTARYDRRPDEVKRKAARLLALPTWQGR